MLRFDRIREERGVALVFAIVFMAVLAAGLTTAIVASSSSGRTSDRSKAAQEAYHLAEAGISSAMSVLHGTQADGQTPVNSLEADALPPPPPDAGAHTDTYDNGTVTWGGTLDPNTQQWTIVSKGVVASPGGPGTAPVERTLTAVSQVVPSLTQPVNNQIWNYIYSFSKTGGCDVDVGGGTAYLAAPIYVEGNLCMTNNAVIQGTGNAASPVNVVVKGKTVFGNNKSAIGTTSKPVNEAHLSGGCGGSLTTTHTCDPNAPTNDNIHAGIFDTTPTSVGVVSPDFDGYYSSANPGPLHPCAGGPTFDNDTARNDSLGATFDVTPATSYTCIGYDGFGNKVGELSWDATAKHLTVSGVIYVDGNISFAPDTTASYDGMATLYASGYMTLNGNVCGVVSGDNCNFTIGGSGWDPNSEMLIVAVEGADANGNSVSFLNNNGNSWQGGIYGEGRIAFQNNATVEGPMIGGTFTFDNNIEAQPFPVITNVPVGAPGNPNVYADAQPPQVTG